VAGDLTERVVESRVLHRGRYLTFRIDTVERADGTRHQRDVCGHPGAVAIVALDADGTVLLVRQFRSPAGETLLEIPAGTLDVDDHGQTEDPAAAARRELEEETGYRASRWRALASFWTAPGFATERMHLFLATDLRLADPEGRRRPEEDERLHLVRLPWREAVALAEAGEIRDAKSLVGLFWLARLQERGEV
jgi:ADP-ribose pyrophosphatase